MEYCECDGGCGCRNSEVMSKVVPGGVYTVAVVDGDKTI